MGTVTMKKINDIGRQQHAQQEKAGLSPGDSKKLSGEKLH